MVCSQVATAVATKIPQTRDSGRFSLSRGGDVSPWRRPLISQKNKRPPALAGGRPFSGDAIVNHRGSGPQTGPCTPALVAAARGFAASRLTASGLATDRLTAAVTTVAAALQPAAQLMERAAARTAAGLAARFAARRLAAGLGLAASGFGFAACRLTAGRFAAARFTTRMAAVAATANQAIEQLERLGAARAGNQRDAKYQSGKQESTFHGDGSLKRVRECRPCGPGERYQCKTLF